MKRFVVEVYARSQLHGALTHGTSVEVEAEDENRAIGEGMSHLLRLFGVTPFGVSGELADKSIRINELETSRQALGKTIQDQVKEIARLRTQLENESAKVGTLSWRLSRIESISRGDDVKA
jgi:hypothetical protein